MELQRPEVLLELPIKMKSSLPSFTEAEPTFQGTIYMYYYQRMWFETLSPMIIKDFMLGTINTLPVRIPYTTEPTPKVSVLFVC